MGAVGLHKGQTFHWDVYSDVQTQGTRLVETNTVPETNYTITQGTLTIYEYGNSVPYTGFLDNLSQHPVKAIIHKVLKHDAKKAFDQECANTLNEGVLRVVPTGGTSTTAVDLTTNGTATETNNVAYGKAHGRIMSVLMKERNIPAYVNDDYYAVGWPGTFSTFKDDLEGIRQYQEEGFRLIQNGELGRYDNIRYIEQTHITKGSLGTAASTWTNGLSDWIVFMGEDCLAEGMAIPEEMRGKIPTDYGRSKGIMWHYEGGFARPHTTAAQHRSLIWDSAA